MTKEELIESLKTIEQMISQGRSHFVSDSDLTKIRQEKRFIEQQLKEYDEARLHNRQY